MKNNLVKIIYFTNVIYLMGLTLCILYGKLSFGHGLGDLAILIFLFALFIIIGLLIAFKHKLNLNKTIVNNILAIILLIIFIYSILSFSIWRGSEQPWDGSIFVSSIS